MATIRRLFRQGNSVVMSIPGWMLERNYLEVGDQVVLMSVDPQGDLLFRKWNPPVQGDVVTEKKEGNEEIECG